MTRPAREGDQGTRGGTIWEEVRKSLGKAASNCRVTSRTEDYHPIIGRRGIPEEKINWKKKNRTWHELGGN